MKESGSSKPQKSRRLASAAIFTAAIFFALPPLTQAAVFNITTEVDASNPYDGVLSLREGVLMANINAGDDTIVLASGGNYQLSNCAYGDIGVTDDANLIIEGNGATITQTCSDQRFFNKHDDFSNDFSLTLNQLSLFGGPNSGVKIEGAAIKASSQLVLNEVSITGVNSHGGSVILIDFGSVDFDLEMDNVTITGNTGTAVRNQFSSGVKMSNSTISDNTGSGISLADGTPIVVENSTISNNGGTGVSTTGQGANGAAPDITITGSTVSENEYGGVFCSASCGQVTITSSRITDNKRRGGISVPIRNISDAGLVIRDSIISGNRSDDFHGGGVTVTGIVGPDKAFPPILIEDSVFENNQTACADCGGGAIAAIGHGELSIIDSTINGNIATGSGGGIYQVPSPDERDNIDDSELIISGTTISNNQSNLDGGGLYLEALELNIGSSTFQGNSAAGGGGGLFIHSTKANISFTAIQDNTAIGNGGGLTSAGTRLILPDGGLGYINGHTFITSSTLSGNAAASGGAVAGISDASTITVKNATVDRNTATVAGGGLLVDTFDVLKLDHVTVMENAAPTGANLAASSITEITRSIISQPVGGGTNCGPNPGASISAPPAITNAGFSWFNDSSCGAGSNDIVDSGGDPQLGPLADNGGPTPTRLPAISSPVVGLVPITDCPLAGDQRETPRPGGLACEAGAVEIAEGMTYQLPDNQWQQISLPTDPGNDNKVDIIFGDDGLGTLGTDWAMFYYDTNNGGYIEIKNGDELHQGVGYWIIQTTGSPQTLEMPLGSQPTPVTNPVGCIESASGCFEIPLEKLKPNATQWHMVGYPFTTARDLSDSRVLTGKGSCAEGCVLGTAENEGIVHNQVWTYNGKSYDLIKGGDQLKPWGAYWSATLPDASDSSPVKLLIPKP
jgi:parallel beta-helix repeat protein